MKNFIDRIYAVAAMVTVVLVSSCSNNDKLAENDPQPVKFSAGVQQAVPGVKAAGTTWDTGDAIGVFMQAATSANDAFNKQYTTADGSNFGPTQGAEIYFPVNGENVDFFPEEAYLDGGIDGNSLTPIESSRSYYLSTHINQFFTDKGAFREFDVFIPVLPTGAPTDPTNHKLYIESSVSFSIGENSTISSIQDFGTYQHGLSFSEDIPFLQNGFEAGKSYYFNLKTE